MNYNSLTFWALFAAVIAVYWFLSHRRQNLLLLVASYVFYGFWDYRFLFLILISTVIDYIGGLGVAGVQLKREKLWKLGLLIVLSSVFLCTPIHYRELFSAIREFDGSALVESLPTQASDFWIPAVVVLLTAAYGAALPWLYALPEARRRTIFLTISMVANLAILGFFKYCDFFLESTQALLGAVGLTASPFTLGIILPAGISFYTFQAMSYTIDIYRGEAEPTQDFPDFALFVCFFPHLVAGPIMRAHTLLPQVVQPRSFQPGAFQQGLILVLVGLFKKIVVADNLAPIANSVFQTYANGDGHTLTGLDVLVGVYAFAFQIYGDFSGYSSVARGISKWLGYELTINFDNPYLAVSPSDFWRRWHISLSSWLRDYLYIPLGGGRGSKAVVYRNLLLTMLLGGLWHGANWTFVVWGLYHGAILCIYRLVGWRDPDPNGNLGSRLRWLGAWVLMFHLTCVGWLLFRADSFTVIAEMFQALASPWAVSRFAVSGASLVGFYALPMFVWEWWTGAENGLSRYEVGPWPVRAAAVGAQLAYVLFMLVIFPAEQAHEFIYFQF